MAYTDLAPDAAPSGQADVPDKPEVPEGTKALVGEWLARIKKAKEHWEDDFKQMRANQDFAYYGADEKWVKAGNYVVPILVRHINQAVSQLYAKNPRIVAKRRRRLMYKIWDGRADSLQSAMQMAAMGDPNGMALIQEVLAVRQQNLMFDRMGKTLEIAFEYFLSEQTANFKQQLKAAVRRTKVTRVAYIKLGFQRLLEPRPEIVAQISDTTSKLATVEAMLQEISEGDDGDTYGENSARMAELKTLLADLQQQEYLVAREGLIFDFPRARSIIIDPGVQHLKSLTGARWAAQEYEMTPDKVMETYKVDIDDDYTPYHPDGKVWSGKGDKEKCLARVYEVWDKKNQQWLTVCEGHHDFLKPPAPPDIYMDRFWPVFPIVFNEVEHEEKPYPPSDVELAKHIQNEYNRSREALRQHRIAARPFYVEDGSMAEEEKAKFANHKDHEIITVPSLGSGEKIQDKVQRGPVANIDPNLYEVEMHFNDLLRTVGSQEANLGGTSNGTATESSIAEQSRGASLADNVDDLDEVLSELAQAGGQVLLTEMSKDKIIEIAGEGAVWPDMPESRQQAAQDLYLEVKAGSSGRPNKASELANRERAMPVLLQIPGVNPTPLVQGYADLLDIDSEELIADGMPSITALNAMMAKAMVGPPGGGDAGGQPGQQGPQGATNAPNPQTNEPGPQAGRPAPMPVGA